MKTSTTYRKIQDKNGNNWYIPTNRDPNRIYFDDHTGEGFSGRVLMLPLEDGTVEHVQGPYHSNPMSLEACTGIEL